VRVGISLLLVALVGCDSGTPLERGERIFQRTCSPCHGADGRKSTAALGFNPPPRDFSNREFQLSTSDEQLKRSIRHGKGQMPAFGGILADSDVDAVILFVRNLGPPELRPAPSVSGALSKAAVPGTPPLNQPAASGVR
jgi:mono/diheme cytochrome c family protein